MVPQAGEEGGLLVDVEGGAVHPIEGWSSVERERELRLRVGPSFYLRTQPRATNRGEEKRREASLKATLAPLSIYLSILLSHSH